MQERKPSKEEWQSWVRDPVTQYFLSGVQEEREYIKELIAQDKVTNQYKEFIGSCLGLQWTLRFATETFDYEKQGEQENGTEGTGVSNPS